MNFENEPWWPKFDRLRSKFGITIVKGDRSRSMASKKTNNSSVTNLNKNNNNNNNSHSQIPKK